MGGGKRQPSSCTWSEHKAVYVNWPSPIFERMLNLSCISGMFCSSSLSPVASEKHTHKCSTNSNLTLSSSHPLHLFRCTTNQNSLAQGTKMHWVAMCDVFHEAQWQQWPCSSKTGHATIAACVVSDCMSVVDCYFPHVKFTINTLANKMYKI